jgi:molybdopterin molybdotransferase
MISYSQARHIIIEQLGRKRWAASPSAESAAQTLAESVALTRAHGRVLAAEVVSDRDYPPFDRATRDGYAVRAAEARATEVRATQVRVAETAAELEEKNRPSGEGHSPANGAGLRVEGEIKAGDTPPEMPGAGGCLRIMTGAALPVGADAVVMVEYTQREAELLGGAPGSGLVRFTRNAHAGQNIVPRGSEARAGQVVLRAGTRMGYAELALAAQVGAVELPCVRKPRVAILSTGDEIVMVDAAPGPFQIRNSNAVSLAAQVRLAGGEPVMVGIAADREAELQKKIAEALQADIVVLSGGVSMGIYDLVEKVLHGMKAEFFFDAVAIRPGKPAVFAMCEGKPVFGLPGNPLSTMVTFELFVAPAIDLYGGAAARALPFVQAELAEDLNEKPGMTHFLPACVEWSDGMGNANNDLAGKIEVGRVRALRWQGSGDIAAMAKANCFLVVGPEVTHVSAGAVVPVLLRRDVV